MPEVETRPSAEQQLRLLCACLLKDTGFSDVVEAVKAGQSATLDGVWGSASALVAAALAERSRPAPVVVVASKSSEIDDLVDSLRLFSQCSRCDLPALRGASQQAARGRKLRRSPANAEGPDPGRAARVSW